MSEDIRRRIELIKRQHAQTAAGMADETTRDASRTVGSTPSPRRPSRRPVLPPGLAGKVMNMPIIVNGTNTSRPPPPPEAPQIVRQRVQLSQNDTGSSGRHLPARAADAMGDDTLKRNEAVRPAVPSQRAPPVPAPRTLLRSASNGTHNPDSTMTSTASTTLNIRSQYEKQIQVLRDELNRKNSALKNIDILQMKLDNAQAEISKLEKDMAETELVRDQRLEKQTAEYKNNLKTLHTRIRKLETDVETAKKQSSSSDIERIQDLESQLDEMTKSSMPMTEVEQIQREYESDIAKLSESMTELQSQKQELTDTLSKYESKFGQLTQICEKLKYNLETERKIRKQRDADLSTTEHRIQELSTELEPLKKQFAEQQQEFADKCAALEELTQEFGAYRQQAEQRLADADRNTADLISIYENVQLTNDELRSKLDRMNSTNSASQAEVEERLRSWEEYSKQLEDERDNLQKELQRVKSTASRHSRAVIGTEEDLLEFIEQMSQKTESLRQEAAELRKANECLQQELREAHEQAEYVAPLRTHRLNSADDSAYGSRNGSSSSVVCSSQTEREKLLLQDITKLSESEAKLQREVNELNREFDRMCMTISASEDDKRKHVRLISDLQKQITSLNERLHEEMTKNFGGPQRPDEPISVASMRKEFRQAFEDVRTEFNEVWENERKARLESEEQLKMLRREQQADTYNKMTQGCQTLHSLTHFGA